MAHAELRIFEQLVQALPVLDNSVHHYPLLESQYRFSFLSSYRYPLPDFRLRYPPLHISMHRYPLQESLHRYSLHVSVQWS